MTTPTPTTITMMKKRGRRKRRKRMRRRGRREGRRRGKRKKRNRLNSNSPYNNSVGFIVTKVLIFQNEETEIWKG